jgi:hypothetical protein
LQIKLRSTSLSQLEHKAVAVDKGGPHPQLFSVDGTCDSLDTTAHVYYYVD